MEPCTLWGPTASNLIPLHAFFKSTFDISLQPLATEEVPRLSKGAQWRKVIYKITPCLRVARIGISLLQRNEHIFALNSVNNETSFTSSQGDLYQRQPLLPTPPKKDKWGNSRPESHKQYRAKGDDDDDEAIRNEPNGIIKINMPPPIREEPRFPQERWKTVIAAIVMLFTFVITLASLAIVHEKVPDRTKYGHLPDVFLDNVPAFDWGLSVSEYIIMICVNSTLLFIILHRHRFIIFRRLFLILSLLYLYRAITMYVTVLPMASETYYCSPKTNQTDFLTVSMRILQLFSGLGLSINGKHTYCGDYIYSGHTVILVISYLFISEYTPKKLYLVHWAYFVLAAVGVFMLQLAHGHYTVDVVIAYFITTRIFWTYHTIANNPVLKQSSPNNYLGREWWFYFFLYFEGNITGPVPRQWPDWPLPWPRRFQSKSRDNDYVANVRQDDEEKRSYNIERPAKFEAYFENNKDDPNSIFNLPGVNFIRFTHKRIKFSFRPSSVAEMVSAKHIFIISLKYRMGYWMVKRDHVPANYKSKIYKLFDTTIFCTSHFRFTDENVDVAVQEIWKILCKWAFNDDIFRREKYKRYQNGEDVYLDEDDEELFLSETEVRDIRRRRSEIWKRMLPPQSSRGARRRWRID
ncbi:hypothetical protein FQR65_LT19285 [Abscondita terminalis]|nr:hypothetical protein FQR65_LT19285 [Abscondita terminalis]